MQDVLDFYKHSNAFTTYYATYFIQSVDNTIFSYIISKAYSLTFALMKILAVAIAANPFT